jgi:hypothetical protein
MDYSVGTEGKILGMLLLSSSPGEEVLELARTEGTPEHVPISNQSNLTCRN